MSKACCGGCAAGTGCVTGCAGPAYANPNVGYANNTWWSLKPRTGCTTCSAPWLGYPFYAAPSWFGPALTSTQTGRPLRASWTGARKQRARTGALPRLGNVQTKSFGSNVLDANSLVLPPTKHFGKAPIPTAIVSCASGACLMRELAAMDDTANAHRGASRIPNGSRVETFEARTGTVRYGGAPYGPRSYVHTRFRAPDGAVHEGWMLPENLGVTQTGLSLSSLMPGAESAIESVRQAVARLRAAADKVEPFSKEGAAALRRGADQLEQRLLQAAA